MSRLSREGIENEVRNSYPMVKGYQCPEAALIKSNKGFEENLMK
jgi:hypothetical protein